jgi:hypothetical protein
MEETKIYGEKKFILIYGGLPWGGGSIEYSILTIFFNPNPRNHNITGIISRFILYAIIFGLGGVLVGYTEWNAKVRKFDNK